MQITIDTFTSSVDDLRFAAKVINLLIEHKQQPEDIRDNSTLDLFKDIKLTALPFLKNAADAVAAAVEPTLKLTPEPVTISPAVPLPTRLPDVITPPPSDSTEELDSDGKPWDATIHSESRAKVADGTWRKRRGGPKVSEVPSPEPVVESTPVMIAGAVDNPVVDAQVNAAMLSATPPVVPRPPVAVPPPPPASVVANNAPTEPNPNVEMPAPATTFKELTEKVTRHFAARKIDSKALNEIYKTFGIDSLQACYRDASLIPLVSAAVDERAMGVAA
jgi:hypothetical protein